MHRMTLGPAFQVDAGGYYMSLLFVFLLALTFSFFSKKNLFGRETKLRNFSVPPLLPCCHLPWTDDGIVYDNYYVIGFGSACQ